MSARPTSPYDRRPGLDSTAWLGAGETAAGDALVIIAIPFANVTTDAHKPASGTEDIDHMGAGKSASAL